MKTKNTLWEYSKGKIVFFYFIVMVVSFVNGWFENSTGSTSIYIGSLIGIFVSPLIGLSIGWLFHNWNVGKTKEQNKKENLIAWGVLIAILIILTLGIMFF